MLRESFGYAEPASRSRSLLRRTFLPRRFFFEDRETKPRAANAKSRSRTLNNLLFCASLRFGCRFRKRAKKCSALITLRFVGSLVLAVTSWGGRDNNFELELDPSLLFHSRGLLFPFSKTEERKREKAREISFSLRAAAIFPLCVGPKFFGDLFPPFCRTKHFRIFSPNEWGW